MLWQKLIGSKSVAPLSGVFLVDIQAQASGASTSLDIGQDQPDRVLVFGCYVRTAPTNGVPTGLNVNGSGVTTTGTNSSGSSGYLYGISTSTSGTTCTFQPTASTAIDGYVIAVWAVYGVLAGTFSNTAQSESSSATTRQAAVTTAGDLLFALALGAQSTLALDMGANGSVDSTLASFTTGLGVTFYYLVGHRDPSDTNSVSATQSTNGALLLYVASAT